MKISEPPCDRMPYTMKKLIDLDTILNRNNLLSQTARSSIRQRLGSIEDQDQDVKRNSSNESDSC
jgi:hypothetical protein